MTPETKTTLEAEGLQVRRADPRDPDYSRDGVFQTHNCWRCKDGTLPCPRGNPRQCENLHARND